MSRQIPLLLILNLISFSIWAQRDKILLQNYNTKPSIEYTTTKANILFDKQDVINEFNDVNDEDWFKQMDPTKIELYKKAVQWLERQSKVTIDASHEGETSEKQVIKSLIENIIGARLLREGKAEIYRQSDLLKQVSIEYKTSIASPQGLPHDFFFVGENTVFFTGMAAGIEVIEEIVIEEPFNEVIPDEHTVYVIVEEPASYPGGPAAFYEYLTHNIRYPSHARKNGIEGKVFVSFIVEKDGSLSDIEIVRKSLDPTLDAEAIRLIKASGKWIPGKLREKHVRQKMIWPVSFKLQ